MRWGQTQLPLRPGCGQGADTEHRVIFSRSRKHQLSRICWSVPSVSQKWPCLQLPPRFLASPLPSSLGDPAVRPGGLPRDWEGGSPKILPVSSPFQQWFPHTPAVVFLLCPKPSIQTLYVVCWKLLSSTFPTHGTHRNCNINKSHPHSLNPTQRGGGLGRVLHSLGESHLGDTAGKEPGTGRAWAGVLAVHVAVRPPVCCLGGTGARRMNSGDCFA